MGNHLYYGDNLRVLRSDDGTAAEKLRAMRSCPGENDILVMMAVRL